MSVDNGKPMVKTSDSRLTHAQHYKLTQWVAAQAERLMEEKPRWKQAAVQASDALGFYVSPSSLPAACRLLGIDWIPKKKEVKPRKSSRVVQLAQLTTKVAQLESHLFALRGFIAHLYTELGVKGVVVDGDTMPPPSNRIDKSIL